MHIRWRRVVVGSETEKARSIGPRIRLVVELVGVCLESRTGQSLRRVTNTHIILLLLGTLMQKESCLSPRNAMIEMASVTTRHEVSVTVCIEVSAW